MLSLLSLLACAPELPSDGFVAPMNGQSGVPSHMPLMLRGEGVHVPPDHPLGDLIRVVDLEVGGAVPGRAEVLGDAVLFHPDPAWPLGRRFAWSVVAPEIVPHGPEITVAEHLLGNAVFDTSAQLDLLAVSVVDDGLYSACLLFSRPLTPVDAGDARVVVQGEELQGLTVDYATTALEEPGLLAADPGVGYACLLGEEPVSEGAVVRVWWGDAGPWSATAERLSLEELAWSRRRGADGASP